MADKLKFLYIFVFSLIVTQQNEVLASGGKKPKVKARIERQNYLNYQLFELCNKDFVLVSFSREIDTAYEFEDHGRRILKFVPKDVVDAERVQGEDLAANETLALNGYILIHQVDANCFFPRGIQSLLQIYITSCLQILTE